MTEDSRGLTAEATQEPDPKAVGGECLPLPLHPGSEKGRGQGQGSMDITGWRVAATSHLLSKHQMELIQSFLGQLRPLWCHL